MKRNLLIAMLLFVVTAVDLQAMASITDWRFRNDDGNEEFATWKEYQHDSLIQTDESNVRLRLSFSQANENGFVDYLALYYKSYPKDSSDVWHLVTNDTNEAFTFSLSPYISNYSDAFQRLTTSSTFTYVTGVVVESPGFISFNLADSIITELEFCIKASPNAVFGKSYIFKIDNVDTSAIDNPDDYLPRIHLQKSILTVTSNNVSRKTGQDNPLLSLSYSGFVDGDNESVLNTQPSKICAANSASPAGTYDIVPYGAQDNKYDFVYIPGKLTVTAATTLDNNFTERHLVYPNPASDFIYLKGEIPLNTKARLYDLSGRLVLEQSLNTPEIDIRSFSNGVYFLSIDGLVYKISKK